MSVSNIFSYLLVYQMKHFKVVQILILPRNGWKSIVHNVNDPLLNLTILFIHQIIISPMKKVLPSLLIIKLVALPWEFQWGSNRRFYVVNRFGHKSHLMTISCNFLGYCVDILSLDIFMKIAVNISWGLWWTEGMAKVNKVRLIGWDFLSKYIGGKVVFELWCFQW